jgi:hypothetical protein
MNFGLETYTLPESEYMVAGFAIRPTSSWWASFSNNGSVQVRLSMSGTVLSVYRGPSEVLLASMDLAGIYFMSEWYHFEFAARIHDTQGTIEVRFNGIQLPALTLTGLDTKPASVTVINGFQLAAYDRFTDIYVDTEFFHGDCIVETLYPTGAGNHADWIPSGGLQAGSNYMNVDDPGNIDGDDTYNMSLSQGDKDSFVAGNLVSRPTSVVKGVAMFLAARKDEAGSREMKPMLRIGGADYLHPDDGFILSDIYHGAQRIWEENPATEAGWTESGVNGAEIGYDLVTGS